MLRTGCFERQERDTNEISTRQDQTLSFVTLDSHNGQVTLIKWITIGLGHKLRNDVDTAKLKQRSLNSTHLSRMLQANACATSISKTIKLRLENDQFIQ